MLIGLQNVTFEFGARAIIEEATWHIHPGERIGLIGYNGTGKSTILKLLVGQYTPSKGTVEKSKETSIGYLHQDLLSFDTNESILEVAMGAFERVKELEKEIEALGNQLETNSEDNDLLMLYSERLHDLEVAGGYTVHHRTEEVLQGLGFENQHLHRPYKEFSGGWRMRVLLAKMILQQPDVLLLDEPTNHLDLPSIEWLEKYLLHYQGSVVIVSHDKFFLNRMVNKIVEVYQQELHIYSGNYEYFETEKAIRIDMQQKAYENQQDYIRQQERFVERFKAKASKAAAAQSIVKRLDKIERIENVTLERPNIKINFQVDKQPGKVLASLKNVSKSFGEINIVKNGNAEIDRGDKIALIGANGKGKSTLLRIIAGTETYDGAREWGHNVDESFYAQHQLEALDLNNTILDEMRECGSKKTDLELRALLGCFLFSGDDADKKIKVLSGGEKARVALAKVIVSKSNFLMLDEPTNHLDMHSVELLADALTKYEGSLILVSHDRYFISKTANKIWEIVDHEIKEFKGSYDEWVAWNERMAKQQASNGKKDVVEKKEEPKKKEETPKTQSQQTNHAIITLKNDLKLLQKKFAKIEEEVNAISNQKLQIETDLALPENYMDAQKFAKLEADYKVVQENKNIADKNYERMFEEIMELENKIS
jgi:ATP-binding cassette subfamily F protein 3